MTDDRLKQIEAIIDIRYQRAAIPASVHDLVAELTAAAARCPELESLCRAFLYAAEQGKPVDLETLERARKALR